MKNRLKAIGYRLYGCIVNICRIFPFNKKKVLFYMHHDCKFQGNIAFVYRYFKEHYPSYKLVLVKEKGIGFFKFYFYLAYQFATSRFIFLNDNFLPIAYMKLNKKTKLIQLWHGAGGYKYFGLDAEKNPTARKLTKIIGQRIDLFPVTGAGEIEEVFHRAMNVPRESIKPIGNPLMDWYFDETAKKASADAFYRQYPELFGKKILLYTPTFRAKEAANNSIYKNLHAEELLKELGEDYAILLRFHPQRPPIMPSVLPNGVLNVTDYEDVRGLYQVSDMLISDYSSTAVEYSLLDKPIIFYFFDFKEFDRGFYIDFNAFPEKFAYNYDELLEAIKTPEKQLRNSKHFKEISFNVPLEYGYTKKLFDELKKEPK